MPGVTPDEIALLLTLRIAIAFLALVIIAGIWLQGSGKHMHISGDVAPNGRWSDFLQEVPDLPSPRQRWTGRRRATVIDAVRGGWVPIEEACQLYNISVDEFLAWERDIDHTGVPGVRTIRYQIYRDTDIRRG
jgi:hypothetical protein